MHEVKSGTLLVEVIYHVVKWAMPQSNGPCETSELCTRNLQQSDKRPKNDSFTLQVPLDFDETKIGFTEVGGREYHKTLSPWDYIRNNEVWVAGGFILGTIPVVEIFIASYQRAFSFLLQPNMSSTDQQVIGAMYSPEMIREQEVQIKLYSCGDGSFGHYGSGDAQRHCLGYICKEAAEIRKANCRRHWLNGLP
ncbi:hypothetical protein Btru_050648 [Bulinus truncatus]|nr:hypothetical protein Btru_050648 [Bulinus truncatus]